MTTFSVDAHSKSGQQEAVYKNVTTKLSCSRPILIKSFSTIGSRRVKVKIRRLVALKSVSVGLEMVQTYKFRTNKVDLRVVLISATMITHTSGRQVVKVKKKPINILEGLKNSKLRKSKYSALTLSDTFTH